MHGHGQPLTPAQRQFFEPRFGRDLSSVRMHTGQMADQTSRAIGARAYTFGSDIAFRAGAFQPDSADGRRLLAHELTHVLQQDGGPPRVLRQTEASGEKGAVSQIVVSLSSNTIDFYTSVGLYRYSVTQQNLQPGEYVAGVKVTDNNVAFTLDPRATQGKGRFSYKLARDKPNPSTFFGSQTEVPFRITTDDAPDPSAVPESNVDVKGATAITPEEAQRRCEANDLPGIKVFPFRGTRFGAAPVSGWREGDDIVIKQPVHVLANDDFRQQTKTLPRSTFVGGVRLKPNELVRVHVYEPRWYHLNVTGSTEGDIEREFCVTGEQMLDIARASTTATIMNIGITAFEGATLFIPVGKIVGVVAKPAARWIGAGGAAVMMGVADVTPRTLGGIGERAVVTAIEEQVVTQAGGRALSQTVAQTVVRAGEAPLAELAPRAAGAAVPSLATGLGTSVVAHGAALGGVDVAGKALGDLAAPTAPAADAAFDSAWDATFSSSQVGRQGAYQTTQQLARGNAGERLAAEALAKDGHTVLMYKPGIAATNQGGIDLVTRFNGVLHLIDNKALSRAGNVSSVTALTKNFAQNIASTRAEFALAAADPIRSAAERQIFAQAVADIDSGNFVRVVTNANIAPDGQVLTGVTSGLQAQGIQFLNVR